eukprot:CAMPEP_0206498674 /NCGR_PEP_ID=MMETSP0324_2-20121206/51179_1 /ASSEMBLY_ACC=CAM_ASM_000836 /TAXON_ID=2866 /ORGANISM="Crypthecodinium cohnii, Strain Seligo" /LENGTH=192 /DNA_ID=CAMNT_0053984995 /DNA_START=197 /DNA_END=774 /DNA_ORIENTATION=-
MFSDTTSMDSPTDTVAKTSWLGMGVPFSVLPQHNTLWSEDLIPHVCDDPAEIVSKSSPAGGSLMPKVLEPQQATVPLERSPQLCQYPDLSWTKTSPSGTFVTSFNAAPQQVTRPSSRSPQVCFAPAAMLLYLSPGGPLETWPETSQPQHTAVRSGFVKLQVCDVPAAKASTNVGMQRTVAETPFQQQSGADG